MLKKIVAVFISAILILGGSVACSSDADVVNKNITKDADNFKVNRRVIFYNAILGEYLLVIEGYCSIDASSENKMAVTCKVGENSYKRHYLGKSDNVAWFGEQISSANVSPNHYKVIFKPSVIIPDIEAR